MKTLTICRQLRTVFNKLRIIQYVLLQTYRIDRKLIENYQFFKKILLKNIF